MSSKYENNPLLYFNDKTNSFKKESDRAIKRGLRKGLMELRDKTRSNLMSSVKGANRKNPKYNDRLTTGIRVSSPRKSKKYEGSITGAVKISSTRKTGSGSFRLAILEQGTFKTPERYATTRKGVKLKKPRYTGSLKAYQFFKKAKRTVSPQKVQSYIDRELNSTINQLNRE